MSARDKLYAYAGTPSVLPETMLDEAFAAYHAEVIAERDAEIVQWLVKKAREFHVSSRKREREQGDTCAVLASKIARGAVHPDNLRMLPNAGFFEVDRTYTSGTWKFRCEAISPSPGTGERRALGWMHKPAHGWYPTALDPDDWEHAGWVEAPAAGEAAKPQHYDKVPDPADGCHWCACGNRWPCEDATAPTEAYPVDGENAQEAGR